MDVIRFSLKGGHVFVFGDFSHINKMSWKLSEDYFLEKKNNDIVSEYGHYSGHVLCSVKILCKEMDLNIIC